MRTEILPIIHTRVDYRSYMDTRISVSVYRHCKVLDENAEQCLKPCQKQPLPLEACGLPSNTCMPGPTPLTMPNDSSIALRTSTQQRNKVPIGYDGTPQIHPPNCPFPFDDHHQNLIHPYRDRPPHHPKRHPDPISHFATIPMCGQTWD